LTAIAFAVATGSTTMPKYNPAQESADKAKELLRHYFRVVAKEAGVNWDSDNNSEVADIVDYIMQAVDARIKEANNG
jgi:hypothetical protein